MNGIVKEDLERIHKSLSAEERSALDGATVLITGCAGFLGFYLLHYLAAYGSELGLRRVLGLDNFKTGSPQWLKRLSQSGQVEFHRFDIIGGEPSEVPAAAEATHILHMASVASPAFYRLYPLETLDANVMGLRRLLDFYREKPIKGLLFFSSSEIYGDPPAEQIPTPETYLGHVSCQGPRACYDEAKRFGETLCYLYHQKYGLPLRIVRPFNNYGPGMRLNDARVPADFARAVYEDRDIVMYSDGSPTRTFCYVSDAVTGYLKALLHQHYNTFNIGIDRPEISVRQLADIYCEAGREIFSYTGRALFQSSADPEYLTHNPNRRCPVIDRARNLLDYQPQVEAPEGVRRFLSYLRQSPQEELIW